MKDFALYSTITPFQTHLFKVIITFLAVLTLLFGSIKVEAGVIVTVPGTANPWLAGMPDGTIALNGGAGVPDTAPGQSPILVHGLPISTGTALLFTVTGSVSITPTPSGQGPDGGHFTNHSGRAEHGISDVIAPVNSLMGVFLGPNPPEISQAPVALDFEGVLNEPIFSIVAGGTDYVTLSPTLKHVFFIGDGNTSGDVAQQVIVPVGATRLYLGTMDNYGWNNNSGSFQVNVISIPIIPEPSTLLLFAVGIVGIAFYCYRRRQKAAAGEPFVVSVSDTP